MQEKELRAPVSINAYAMCSSVRGNLRSEPAPLRLRWIFGECHNADVKENQEPESRLILPLGVEMLIDWPTQKAEVIEWMQRRVRSVSFAKAGIAAQIPHFVLHECSRVVFVFPDGSRQEMQPQTHEASAQFSREDIEQGGGRPLVDGIATIGSNLGDQMEKEFLGVLQNAAPQHGGKFGGEHADEVFEQILKGLENMDLEFDETGDAGLFFVVHPNALPLLQELNTPVHQKRFDEVLSRKRDEWLSRESHRRLAD